MKRVWVKGSTKPVEYYEAKPMPVNWLKKATNYSYFDEGYNYNHINDKIIGAMYYNLGCSFFDSDKGKAQQAESGRIA